VVVPAFAEEMNRSRRMVALQARDLAATGIRTVVFDLFGTGDSEGDFGSARWEIWTDDLASIAAWSRASGARRLDVLAVRLGALLAAETEGGFDSAVLWQPCTSGKTYLRQFLRLRMAEKLINDAAQAETVTSLLARLAAGESLEVAGYELAAPLGVAIEARSFDAVPKAFRALRWLDLVAAHGDPPPASTATTLERWKSAGARATSAAVAGDPFWSLQEITVAPRLVEATTRAFALE
jgi:exosortase A-associated hydrolase 2